MKEYSKISSKILIYEKSFTPNTRNHCKIIFDFLFFLLQVFLIVFIYIGSNSNRILEMLSFHVIKDEQFFVKSDIFPLTDLWSAAKVLVLCHCGTIPVFTDLYLFLVVHEKGYGNFSRY